jgi:hypothetical protein
VSRCHIDENVIGQLLSSWCAGEAHIDGLTMKSGSCLALPTDARQRTRCGETTNSRNRSTPVPRQAQQLLTRNI